jgi:type IV pilus assembly protein PilA
MRPQHLSEDMRANMGHGYGCSLMVHKASERGYSLIELLVVIAILSILASLTLLSFLKYEREAFDVLAEGDARSAYIAAQTYFTQHPRGSISSVGVLTQHGLIKTSEVNVVISGTIETLSIRAYHNQGSRTFTVNSEGSISW